MGAGGGEKERGEERRGVRKMYSSIKVISIKGKKCEKRTILKDYLSHG